MKKKECNCGHEEKWHYGDGLCGDYGGCNYCDGLDAMYGECRYTCKC